MLQASLAPPSGLGTSPLACTAASALAAPAVAGPPRELMFGSTGPLPPRHTVRQALLQVFLR